MHLEITQSTSLNEPLSGSSGVDIINKLYNLHSNNVLDLTSTVSGRISTYAASKNKVEYLAGTNGVGGNGVFPNLYISCTTYYVDFLDSEFGRIVANVWGDGNGVTTADIASITASNSNAQWSNFKSEDGLKGNTNVTTLDFRKFGSIALDDNTIGDILNTSLLNVYINNCSKYSLGTFGWSNGTGVSHSGGLNSRIIDKVIINNILDTTAKFLNGSGNSGLPDVNILAIRNIPDIAKNGNLMEIGSYFFRRTKINNLYIGATTPPYLTFGTYSTITNAVNIYVPTGYVSTYEAASGWNTRAADGNGVKFLEYDFENDPDGIFSIFD